MRAKIPSDLNDVLWRQLSLEDYKRLYDSIGTLLKEEAAVAAEKERRVLRAAISAAIGHLSCGCAKKADAVFAEVCDEHNEIHCTLCSDRAMCPGLEP